MDVPFRKLELSPELGGANRKGTFGVAQVNFQSRIATCI